MDLLDRYLNAVNLALMGALTPRSRREDILAELRDDILSRVEEQEGAEGRPLTDAEWEAVLRASGHPLRAAGRFSGRQALIGPAILPLYEMALVVLAGLAVALAVVNTALTGDLSRVFEQAPGQAVNSFITFVGLATLVAMLLERFQVRLGFLDDWRPRDLPDVSAWIGGPSRPGAAPRRPSRLHAWLQGSRWDSLAELVVSLLFIGWWTGLRGDSISWRTAGGEGYRMVVAPALLALYWPVLLTAALGAVSAAGRFLAPYATRVTAALDAVSCIASLALIAALAMARPLVRLDALRGGDAGLPELARLQRLLDHGLTITLAVAALITTAQLARALFLLTRRRAVVV